MSTAHYGNGGQIEVNFGVKITLKEKAVKYQKLYQKNEKVLW